MKRFIGFIGFATLILTMQAQGVLSLDSCRTLALKNNKELLIGNEKIKSAYYERKAAITNYFPEISAMGTYMRNQKEISLLNDEQKHGLANVGTASQAQLQGFLHDLITASPGLGGIIGSLPPIDIAQPLNAVGQSLVDALRTDTRNMYAGAITLTQPLYMGGKIRAYNKITNYAEQLAKSQQNNGMQEVILSTDQAYWQVISLVNKKKLAKGYLELLQKLESDVDKMITEGVATKADGLSVKVKVNEAEMTLNKVENGLSLSRMLLCQLCGIDLSTPIQLADEQIDSLISPQTNKPVDMNAALSNRPELRSLELAENIYHQKINITRAEHLPSVALLGNYLVSNPSVYNGFENKFNGAWNVGVMVKIPIWHWGEGMYKVKAAKAEARVAHYRLQDAKEKIELQVSQATFKVNEATKNLQIAAKNMEKANENLRYATLGFDEGVIPSSNVLEAHTAWLAAHSEKIDAEIDVKLTNIYLQKATGILKQ